MKKTYFTPLTEVEQVQIEHNFAASPWYNKKGEGDFIYEIEEQEEETWG